MGRAAFLTGRPIAHRGFHDAAAGRIENTLSAADAAIARNFAIECDLQLSGECFRARDIEIANAHAGTFCAQAAHSGCTNTGGTTADQDGLTLQIPHRSILSRNTSSHGTQMGI